MVVGDGVHTIRELVEIENKSDLRGYGHEKPQTKIRLDNVASNYLGKNNLTVFSVPKSRSSSQVKGKWKYKHRRKCNRMY